MLDIDHKASPPPGVPAASTPILQSALVAGWRDGLPILNLRGSIHDIRFCQAVQDVLRLELPLQAGTTTACGDTRMVWVGPDDWFVIGATTPADKLVAELRSALADQPFAATDVGSGYAVMHLSGRPVREVLAAGCPLDLHPRVFGVGSSAGSHFFKASVWLWQVDESPSFELLVRRSFMNYFWLMLERTCQECGLIKRRFRPPSDTPASDAPARGGLLLTS